MISHLILRLHALFLMVLTTGLTGAAFAGLHAGIGPFAWVQEQPVVLLGLVQAYLLMGLISLVMWCGARSADTRIFSLLAIAAHCVPLLTLALLWDVVQATGATGTLHLSFVIHGTWITVEAASVAVLYRVPFRAA